MATFIGTVLTHITGTKGGHGVLGIFCLTFNTKVRYYATHWEGLRR